MKQFKNADITVIGEKVADNGQFITVRADKGSYFVDKKGLEVTDLPQAEKSEDAVSEQSEPVKKPAKRVRKKAAAKEEAVE